MKCDFCGREVPDNIEECPYCHYRFTLSPQTLSPAERDSFEGVTIEEDGTDSGASEKEQRDEGERPPRQAPVFQVRTFGCSGGFLFTLLFIVLVLAFVFFVMPMFFVFALVGAAVVALLRFLAEFF